MQMFTLHKSIYKLNRSVAPEESFDPAVLCLKERMERWRKLKSYNVPDFEIAKTVGISRATYYRYLKFIETYGLKGIERRSRRPKRLRLRAIPESTVNHILEIRRGSPTYGKAKIAVILKRDFGVSLSESSVGRVLKSLLT